MYKITIIDKNPEWEITSKREIILRFEVEPFRTGFCYKVYQWDDISVLQEFDPTKWGFELMTEEDATKYASIVTARMLATNIDIIESLSGWDNNSYWISIAVLNKTKVNG